MPRSLFKIILFVWTDYIFYMIKMFSRRSWRNFVLARTYLGTFRGSLGKTRSNRNVYCFRSVPYGKIPARFSLPEPITEPYCRPLDCTKRESPKCLQPLALFPESKFFIGVEDCLYLNVFTPKMPVYGEQEPPKLPVLVWFHGGAFIVGDNDSAVYGPDYLLDDGNVILVTVNYRLGPFGFLSLCCEEAPGNQGLQDQVLALKWVQRNIEAFGGDPGNVTIFGQSAGGMSSTLHLASPLSRGLFHKVIVMSGAVSTPFLHLDRTPDLYARKLAEEFGCGHGDSPKEILRVLRSVSAKAIAEKTLLFKDWDVACLVPWKPTIDGIYLNNEKAFLPKGFSELMNDERKGEIAILHGVVREDGLILTAPYHKSARLWDLLFDHWEIYAPQIFLNREAENVTECDVRFVTKIRGHFFRGEEEIKPKYTRKNLEILERMYSLSHFLAPFARDNFVFSRTFGRDRVWAFIYCHEGSMTMADLFRLSAPKLGANFVGRYLGQRWFREKLGVCHADELFSIFPFKVLGFPNCLITEEDKRVSRRFVKILISFASDGSPGEDSWDNALVPNEISLENVRFMKIANNESSSSGSDIDERFVDDIRFWEKSLEESRCLERDTVKNPVRNIYRKTANKRRMSSIRRISGDIWIP